MCEPNPETDGSNNPLWGLIIPFPDHIPPEGTPIKGMGESDPFVMDVKNGKLKLGDILDEAYINKLRRKKDIEKAHQYNRRTDFKVLTTLFYDIESDEVKSKTRK